jgi:hypothetical protein
MRYLNLLGAEVGKMVNADPRSDLSGELIRSSKRCEWTSQGIGQSW